MAKGNLILGTASGKLGDTVMYRKDGQQLSRVRVRKIGNPRTQSQAVNRALLNTLSTAYAYMKGIVDHSFQGLSKPVENQRKFAKLNQGIARETGSVAVPGTDTGYNFNFKGESLLRPNRYAISRGTMPSVEVFNIAAAGGLIAGFQLNQALTALLETTTTYKQFCDAIGVAVGTQLTFCIVSDDTFTGTPSESNMPKSYGNFHFARIILSDDNGNGDVPMFDSVGGDIVINSNYANSKNSGALKFKRLGETSLRIEVENQSYPLAMGVIVSNYSSRMWLRSNTDMVVAEGYEDSNTMSEVYMSYMQSEGTPISNLYLNQGEGTTTYDNPTGAATFAASIVTVDGEQSVNGINLETTDQVVSVSTRMALVTPIPVAQLSNASLTLVDSRLCDSPRSSAAYLQDNDFDDAACFEAATTAREGKQYVYIYNVTTAIAAAPCDVRLVNGQVITFRTED
jgi:hypothetical protein